MAATEANEAFPLADAGTLGVDEVLRRLDSSKAGLSSAEAAQRRELHGPNVLPTRRTSAWEVLLRQFRSPLLLLLLATATVAGALGERTDALIIAAILALSVGLSFFDEYRAEQAVQELHDAIAHTTSAERDGAPVELDVGDLVPGDIVHLKVGDVVPADIRLLETHELECDESALTGESQRAEKTSEACPAGESALDLASCVLMGTVVASGDAVGVVVQTGGRTTFGGIARHLGDTQSQTQFQKGLQEFSTMLASITATLAVAIFAINALLGRSLLQSGLFALAIAVGLTPQLLPAIVTVSLATGSRLLAKKRVVVKRLISIEDLGNVEVLCTDKTGTLTEGRISFLRALDAAGSEKDSVRRLGLACAQRTGNDLDQALWQAKPAAEGGPAEPLDELPFDHERQLASVLADTPQGRLLVSKGAPEAILARCTSVPPEAQATLDGLFSSGARVVAVATRSVAAGQIGPADEHELELAGFLCFADPVKDDARASLARLAKLHVDVKILTGDNGQVAAHVCEQVGLDPGTPLPGSQLDTLDDETLQSLVRRTTVFSRVTPEQKSRVIKALQGLQLDVAYLGDGVNDVIALHDSDVGISVESAVDVAKDAADVVLLDKDLGVLADGVTEGRRIFGNTMKYVLMGTSSNFGNMFSAAGASLFLSFLPMLPTQILLNNLLYDVSEMTIPTDAVDEELLVRPAHWDVGMIRRFMAVFGPLSSIYDFLTFAVMLRVFHAGPVLFRSGWFVESLTTQTLVVFVIRTRRIPFIKSRPSRPLLVTTLMCAGLAVTLPYIPPLAHLFGFTPLPARFLGILAVMIVTYLSLVEYGVGAFFRHRTPSA